MFGRRQAPDPRDLLHPMLPHLTLPAIPSYRYWMPGAVLDQGDTGTCVGHGWEGWLLASPLRTRNGPSPFDIYCQALPLDGFTDNDNDCSGANPYQMGTTVRAAAKALQADKRIGQAVGEYVWAPDVATVKRWLAEHGTVVIGIDWYTGMMQTDADGYARPTGNVEGGHCVLVYGYSDAHRAVSVQNSWGRSWGRNGRCRLSYADLEQLLAASGEACGAVEVSA